jgi:CheY-like chemotaxis protein
MKQQLKSILLVDDDPATNFLHTLILRGMHCTESIKTVLNGKEALEYLRAAHAGEHPVPELVFLDINMPVTNGWEFLEEYETLPLEQRSKTVIVMLTTSLNPDDIARSEKYEDVQAYRHKPLEVKMMTAILEEFFLPQM